MSIKSTKLSLNGATYDIPYDASSKKYKKTITAPTGSSFSINGYPMILRVEDEAGNVTSIDKNHATYGSVMILKVVERNPPVLSIVRPASGAYVTSNAVVIEFTVTDSDSGVKASSISMQVDSLAAVTSGLTKVAITGGFRCTYTATLSDGRHTLKINASDNDGNAAVQKTATFIVDTVPPELNVSGPSEQMLTNKSSGNITGTTNDVTSAPVVVSITLNGVDQGAVTVNADGTFTKAVTWKKGSNTVVVKATDKAGKSSTVSRAVIYDPDAPVIVSIAIAPNPVEAGSEFVITVEATD